MKTRLLVADGHTVYRETVSIWLSQNSEFEVLTPAADGCRAMALARRLRPDVILMDAVMPHLNGIDATREIIRELPDLKVIVFSEAVNSQSVCAAIEAGAAGYLSKYCSSEELIRAIQDVVSEGTYLCSAASAAVVQRYLCAHNVPVCSGPTPLTPQRRHIVQEIAEGQSIKEIARELETESQCSNPAPSGSACGGQASTDSRRARSRPVARPSKIPLRPSQIKAPGNGPKATTDRLPYVLSLR